MVDKTGKTCKMCGQIFDPSIAFCPIDGTRLPTELVTAQSHELISLPNMVQPAPRGNNGGTIPGARPAYVDSGTDELHVHPDDGALAQTSFDPDLAAKRDRAVSRETAPNNNKGSLPVGYILADQYEIISLVGRGGMSYVYKAKHLLLKKIVAIKSLLPHLMTQTLSLQRFQQEAQAASTLKHPNIIAVQDFGTTADGEPFIVMDYIEGSSLAEEIEDYEYLPIDRSVKIFLQVADALVHAHSKGIVHRDLKPSNIILIILQGVHDHVQIVDFGIAKMMPQEGAEALNLTQTGEVFGSPLYMSPEQSRGEKLDARSDIYSMGCLMYETLTGRHAIAGENTMEVLYNHLNQVPEPMSSGEIKIPTALEKIIFTALAKDPAQRFQSMADLYEHLRAFENDRHGNLARKLADHWSVFWLRRKPRTARAKAAIVGGFAAFLIIVMLSTNLVSLYLAAAQSPEADTKIVWFEDNRPVELPPQALNGEIAYNMFLRKTQILADDHADPNDIINEFEAGADSLAKKKLWNEANRLLRRAVDLSLQSNGQVTIKTVALQVKLADSFQAMHKYSEASAVYSTINRALSREFEKDVEDQALLSFRSGSNSYFLGHWLDCIRQLSQSYDVWLHKRRKPGGHMHFFSVPDDILSSNDFGLTLSRLASAQQRLYEESESEGAPDASHLHAAIDFYKQAIAFWSNSHDSSAKFNRAVAEANYLVLAPQDDRNVERENLVAEYKENFAPSGAFAVFPEDSLYRAIVLQNQAKFLAEQHDYFNAFSSRLAAWKILAARYKANH